MDLKNADLNLLVLFQHLMRYRNVSRAAAEMDLAQSTVSSALGRLRAQFDDPLFVLSAKKMEPTPFAMEISQDVLKALDLIQNALSHSSRFDPATSRRSFNVAMSDVGEICLLPALLQAVRCQGEHIGINVVRPDENRIKSQMEAGEVDITIGRLGLLESGFFRRSLLSHEFVCMFRRGHPVFTIAPMSRATFIHAEHVVVEAASASHKLLDDYFKQHRIERAVRLRVPDYFALGPTLTRSDLLSTVPRRLAVAMGDHFDLAWCAHPFKMPRIDIGVYWHSRYARDAGLHWLRDLIGQGLAEATG